MDFLDFDFHLDCLCEAFSSDGQRRGGNDTSVGSARLPDRQRLDGHIAAQAVDIERELLQSGVVDAFAYEQVYGGNN